MFVYSSPGSLLFVYSSPDFINICLLYIVLVLLIFVHCSPVAEFKEFERRFEFKPRFKYGWFHLKLYQMFQDLSRR